MRLISTAVMLTLVLCSIDATAQLRTVTGSVADTSATQPLRMATIVAMRVTDSVLVRFTYSDDKGQFRLDQLPATRLLLWVSYPGYADFTDEIDLTQADIIDKPVYIIPKSKLLQEIIIQQKVSAIRIKGDTTEFKADSFKVGPNANVQDLLKRLPGLQVNSKGEITAQGQKVEKILVDGEEFFSDDPAVVAKNLRADVVDKVQVFDKKSAQAEFTGVDDGQKTKTINLELKEEKKKGFFGKAEAGSDGNRYRNGQVMINAFKKKRKIAAYLTHNNTSFEGLNWQDRRNFGADETNMEMSDDGGMMIFSSGDEFSSGNGFPQSTSAGVTYANKWKNDKHALNSNYQFNNQLVNGSNQNLSKTILPDTSFSNNTTESFFNLRNRNKVTGTYVLQADSLNTIQFKTNAGVIRGSRSNGFIGQSVSEDGRVINESNRTTTAETEDRSYTGELLWKRKFKKTGRTLSINNVLNNNQLTGEGLLLASNRFFNPDGSPLNRQDLDQLKTNDERKLNLQSTIAFTEALGKKWFLELNYKFAKGRNNAERNTLEKALGNDKYTELVDTLSNHFLFRTTDHSGGFAFRFTQNKFSFTAGSALGRTNFGMEELNTGANRKAAFTNLLPRVTIKFSPKKQQTITFNYNGTTRNPTLLQINPIIDNIDPLNITIGNELLKQAFSHNFRLEYNNYKVLKSQYTYFSAQFNTDNNAISTSNFIDNLGRSINQSVNVNGNYNGWFFGLFGFEVLPGINLTFRSSGNISRWVNVVNGIRNVNDNNRLSLSTGLSRWSDKWLSFQVDIEATRNNSVSSINKDRSTRFWQFTSNHFAEMKFPKQKLTFRLNGELNIYQRTDFAPQQQVYLVGSVLQRTFGKANAWELRFSVNDLFNQNRVIERNITSNFISETTRQNLRRFWLLTVAWNFSKNGKPSAF